MGLSNYVPNSRVSQAGVCTSTTRPATPYEGQVIYETDTNRVLVYDASAWVMIADTDQPPALQLVKTQTVGTAVSSVTVTNAFSADFENYRVIISGGTSSSGSNLRLQLSSSTSSTYVTSGIYLTYGSATVTGFGPAATTSWYVGYFGSGFTSAIIDIISPFSATQSRMNAVSSSGYYYNFMGQDTSTASSSGFTIFPDVGTITGQTVRVYGYRN